MFSAKVAFALLLDRVALRDQWAKIATITAITAWTVFSLFTFAFQCPFPHPWVFELEKCSTHGNLLYSVVLLNAITDVLLAFWVVPTIWKLRLNRADRALTIILFSMRTMSEPNPESY